MLTHGQSTPNNNEAAQRRHRRGGMTTNPWRFPRRRRRYAASIAPRRLRGLAPTAKRRRRCAAKSLLVSHQFQRQLVTSSSSTHQLAYLCRDQWAESVARGIQSEPRPKILNFRLTHFPDFACVRWRQTYHDAAIFDRGSANPGFRGGHSTQGIGTGSWCWPMRGDEHSMRHRRGEVR